MHKIYLLPNTEPILFLPHFHLFLTYIFPHILSLLAKPRPLYPFGRGEISFLWALSPKQLSYNHHLPDSPLDSIPFHPSPPTHSWPTGSVNFNISSQTLLLLPFLSAPLPVLVILPASQSNQGAQNLTSLQVLQGDSSEHTRLNFQSSHWTPKAITQIQQPQRVLLPTKNVFEGTKPQSTAVSTKNHWGEYSVASSLACHGKGNMPDT